MPPAEAPGATPSDRAQAVWPSRLAGALLVLGLVAGALAVGARRLGDPDLPWHLAIGRLIVEGGGLPRTDDLTYTFRGTPYPSEYLGELLLYGVLRGGGAVGLQLLGAVCAALIALLVIGRAGTAPRMAAAAAAALALSASEVFLVVRPALLSLVAWATALWLVDAYRRGARGPRSLWLLIPLQLAWSAVHGFALLGALLAIGYALFGLLARAARGRWPALLPDAAADRVGEPALVAAMAVAATAAGPIGWRLFTAPWRAIEYGGYLTEWTPVTLRFVVLHAPAFGVLAALCALALLPRRPLAGDAASSNADLFDLALCGGALALALLRTRMVPVFAIAAAPLVARRLGGYLAAARLGPLLAAIVGLAVAPVVLLSAGSHLGRGFDEDRLPEGAVRYVLAHHPSGPPWNFLSFGGWLEFRLYPEVRAFIDGRTSYLIPFSFFHDYALAEHDPARFAALAQRYHFGWAVVPAGPGDRFSEPIAANPRFTLVHLDDVAAVYVRADGDNRALAQGGYQALRHLTEPTAMLSLPAAALRHDAGLALADDPRSARAHFLAAAAALVDGDIDGARRERDRAEDLDPLYPGLSLLHLGSQR